MTETTYSFETEVRDKLSGLDVRVGKLESKMEHMATKEDIAELKVSMWRAYAGLGVGFALIIYRLFS